MKYNKPKNTITKTTNLAGGEAYQESPKLELVSILLTSFVKDKFYRTEAEEVKRLQDLIPAVDKKFAAKAAIYARNEFGMRSISHVLTAELFRKRGGESMLYGATWAKQFVKDVIRRPDDATEILAYYKAHVMEKALPKQLKLGLAEALRKFDEYQLAKYKGDGKAFKLVDIANLTHPDPSTPLNKLMKGELKPAETWEVKMTQAGQKAETEEQKTEFKADAWKQLLTSRRIGYTALLRNLRNICEQAPEMIDTACALLTDEKLIKQSLILPFQYMTAIRQLEQDKLNQPKVFVAMNKALELSLANIPELPGKTLVVVDHSGSMDSIRSGKLTQYEIGALFGIALAKKLGADFMHFGSIAKYVTINPTDSLTTLVEKCNKMNNSYFETSYPKDEVGHGTNFHTIFTTANKKYDRIVIFSDMQGWIGHRAGQHGLDTYNKKFGADPYLYSIDLAGYGTLQFPENKVFALAGFSDKIFDLMKKLEQDRQALIHKIEAIDL